MPGACLEPGDPAGGGARPRGRAARQELIEAAQLCFSTETGVRVDYIELVDWATLEPVENAGPSSLFAVAAWVGLTG